jgi:glucosamine--fructose-6-phosphate aminotransferase (isomerizing)
MKYVKRGVLISVIGLFFVGQYVQSCSIVGYLGNRYCKSFIMEGLSRLEYRGYDSAGFASVQPENNELVCVRAEGKLLNLSNKLQEIPADGLIGIGHTRWATHGAATECNAHPHVDCHNDLAVVHNGIIENHFDLKKQLQAEGHLFASDTDTEVISHLFESSRKKYNTLQETAVDVANTLTGAYACIVIMKDQPDTMVAMRKGSPICIGIGQDEMFVGSDFLAFAGKTDKVVFLPDESCAIIKKDSLELYGFDGNPLDYEVKTLNVAPSAYEKLGHEHFMLKEIYEQKRVVAASVEQYKALGDVLWEQLGVTPDEVRNLKRVCLFGCGTSWHAARIAQFFFETVCKIPTYIYLASEFRYMPFFKQEGSLYIGITQSGETADTLEAIRLIKKHNEPVITLTNGASSTCVRESSGYFLLHALVEVLGDDLVQQERMADMLEQQVKTQKEQLEASKASSAAHLAEMQSSSQTSTRFAYIGVFTTVVSLGVALASVLSGSDAPTCPDCICQILANTTG